MPQNPKAMAMIRNLAKPVPALNLPVPEASQRTATSTASDTRFLETL